MSPMNGLVVSSQLWHALSRNPSESFSTVAVLPAPVAMLFWVWVFGSLGAFIYRRVKRPNPTPDDDLAAEVDIDIDIAAAVDADQPTAPIIDPNSGRTGLFAPKQVAASPPSPKRIPVADALTGIAMPSGLAPSVDPTRAIPDPFRVSFLTRDADAAAVGSAIGDELERLGFVLSSTSETVLRARKGDIDITVTLYPEPWTATRGLDRVFPIATQGSVGLEFST
ncbi:MAG: hypothetical protein WCK41_01065 [Actinomycetes bacterium]